MRRSEIDKEKLSPMMKQYIEIKENNEDCIIFFRLGDFYEMFFEDAVNMSKILDLTLTGKQAGLEEKIPMCGIPHHAASNYLEILIEKGYKVALVEQMEDAKDVKGMVTREVVQIVTKGTIIDTNLDSKSNNFIASIYDFNFCFILVYIDISTGEVNAKIMDNDIDKMIKEVIRLGVKEVIVSDNINREIVEILRSVYNVIVTITNETEELVNYKYIYKDIDDDRIITGIKHLLNYIISNKKSDLVHLQECSISRNEDILRLDINTIKNLELITSIKDSSKQYTLFWLLDKCMTAMGSRYLKHNILNPLTSIDDINHRYDLVEKFSTEFILRDDLINELDNVYDLERLVGKVSYKNLNPKDLLQLKNSIKVFPNINKIIKDINYKDELIILDDLYSLLEKSINEDAPFNLNEGNIIKNGFNKELDELREISSNSKEYIIKIEQEEIKKTGIKNLKVGFNKVFGYYIEVTKGQKHLIKDEFGYDRKQTLANCERFITPLLKEKEDIILSAHDKIIKLEYKLFNDVKEATKRYIDKIQYNAKIISEIDLLQAFSICTDKYKLNRPIITNDNIIKMVDCRHPVVENVIKDKYVSNDVSMNQNTNILLITGPNMSGKSTYMRQTAISIIMAQIGCFVPCSSATMPIFDQIFTRIGASDDLVSGESTFMIEMKEAELAISNATNKSLILFDELGRGTATYDGMSIAQAILEYIHDTVKAKTIFSTHYHELTALEQQLPTLKNIHVAATEENDKITFLHKIRNGAVDKSYGINVAALAKLPKPVIKRASEILDIYEKSSVKKSTFTQTSLFEITEVKEESKIEEEIKKLDPLNMTPLEALECLYQLKKNIEDK